MAATLVVVVGLRPTNQATASEMSRVMMSETHPDDKRDRDRVDVE
jgi:hypothetical protein